MKCVYRVLKESITDTTFPTLPVVVEKDYFYQTEASQSIDISSLLPTDLKFNKLRMEAVVKPISLDYDQTQPNYLVYTRGGVTLFYSVRNYLRALADANALNGPDNPASVDTLMISDGDLNLVSIGETSQVGQTAVSTSKIQTASLLGSGATAMNSIVKIKEVKLIDKNNDTLFAHLVPATFNGVGCVYDKISGQLFYPSSGTLGID